MSTKPITPRNPKNAERRLRVSFMSVPVGVSKDYSVVTCAEPARPGGWGARRVVRVVEHPSVLLRPLFLQANYHFRVYID